MADYSFSSSAMRKKRPNFKMKTAVGESSDAQDALPIRPPAHKLSIPPTQPHERPSGRRAQGGSQEENTDPLSPSDRSISSGGSKVKQYINNLNNAQWPPPAASNGSNIRGNTRSSENHLGNGLKPIKTPYNGAVQKVSLTDDSSDGSSDNSSYDSSQSEGSSDDSSDDSSTDSDFGGTKTIDKYRRKYLDGDIDGKIKWAQTSGTGSPAGENLDDNTKYDNYRKQLTESKSSEEKWMSPKKKLGAPPSIEYNYRYMNVPKLPLEEKPKISAPTPDTKPKWDKVDLKSKKIDKDDLGILASMLGDDSSADGETSSHGIFSTNSEDDTNFAGTQSHRSEVTQEQVRKSEALKEVSVDSGTSSNMKEVQEVEVDKDNGDRLIPDKLNDSSEKPLSIRMVKLQQTRREKASVASTNASSSSRSELDKSVSSSTSQRKDGRSNAVIPPKVRENEIEEDLSSYLKNETETRTHAKEKTEASERSDDDFSEVWGRSVGTESRRRAKPNGDDESLTEGSIEIQNRRKPLSSAIPSLAEPASQTIKEDLDESSSLYNEEDVEASHHSTSTLEASNSMSHYESSGMIEVSGRSVISDVSSVELMSASPPPRSKAMTPVPPPMVSTERDQMRVESSDSESDGSIDFEKLTGLEQYTMKDSRNSSLQLETPVISNKKEVKRHESSKKDTNSSVERKGNLMAIDKEEEGGSDISLDAVNFGTKPSPKQPAGPERKRPSLVDDDDDDSMSDFSLNPSKDLVEEKSSSEFNKPEYEPQRNSLSGSLDLNDGFQRLDSSTLFDLEDQKDEDASSKASKPAPERKEQNSTRPSSVRRTSIFSTGFVRHLGRAWVLLFMLAAMGLPIYFLLFYDKKSDGTLPSSLNLFPTTPTSAPTTVPVAPPTDPPMPTITIIPTTKPTPIPMTEMPTPSPTRSRISLLREFLITVWPSLEDDFVGLSSPQYLALDWLANNVNYESFSDDRLIQRFALATLFYSTGGILWRRNDLWLSDEDECMWYSGSSQSQCDESGSYIRLELDLNDLSGTLPSEVALMTNLQEINFSKSGSLASLSSTLPSAIGLLANLKLLNLRGNDLTGSLTSWIGSLVNLENLDLSINQLSGELPNEIGGMTRLRFWNLAQNSLSGQLPPSIGLMVGLQKVQLSNNDFSGPIPTDLGRLSLLNSMDLNGNRFSRLPTELGNLVLMQKFSAANNQLQGNLPNGIGNMIELLSLQIQNNSLTGTIPSEIGNLIELRDSLDLSNNRFSGPIPTELGRLIFLRNMLLYANQLTGAVPTSFSALRRLSVLRLEANDFSGTVPNATCAVFNQTYPVFVTDCTLPEITCPCCIFCCEDFGDCSCQFSNTDLDFLCSAFTRAPGLEDRMTTQ